jgi:hypothetical protein
VPTFDLQVYMCWHGVEDPHRRVTFHNETVITIKYLPHSLWMPEEVVPSSCHTRGAVNEECGEVHGVSILVGLGGCPLVSGHFG